VYHIHGAKRSRTQWVMESYVLGRWEGGRGGDVAEGGVMCQDSQERVGRKAGKDLGGW